MNWINKNLNTVNYILLIIGAGLFGAALVGLIRGCLGSEQFGWVCYADQPTRFIATTAFYGFAGLFSMGSILFQKQFVDLIGTVMGWKQEGERLDAQKRKLIEKLESIDAKDPELKKIVDDLKKNMNDQNE